MRTCQIITAVCLLIGLIVSQSLTAYADARKYCAVYSGKDPRKFYCLQKVSSQVSYDCRKEINKVGGSQAEFLADCEGDFHRFCSDVVPGEGRIVACLKQHSKEVSFECRKILVTAP